MRDNKPYHVHPIMIFILIVISVMSGLKMGIEVEKEKCYQKSKVIKGK